MQHLPRLLCVLFLGLLPLGHSGGQETRNDLTVNEKIYGLSLIWQEANYNFAFFDQVPDLDWDSTYRAFIPRVMAVETVYDYYRELQRFMANLHDGHSNVYLPDYLGDSLSFPKIVLGDIGNRAIVVNVDRSLEKQIPMGSEILEVDGSVTNEHITEKVLPYISSSTDYIRLEWAIERMLRGWINTTVTVSFRTPDGRTDKLQLTRNREGVDWLKSRELYHELVEFKWLDDKVAYVALNSFNNDQVVEDFEVLLPDLYDADGVILDLRNNGGGNTGIGAALLGHFTSDTLRGSAWKTREHVAAYKAWGQWADQDPWNEQYRPYFEGTAWHEGEFHELAPAPGKKIEVPFIVLIGHMTGSAAEDFLIYADALDQATYVGRPSTGSTGQPLQFKLPGGGSARICTKKDTYPDGREFVGYGVQPHVPVEPTVESFLSGEDITLQKGIEVLNEKIAEEKQ